jgi:hypothetical protein
MRDGTVSASIKVHLEDRTDQRELIAAVDLGVVARRMWGKDSIRGRVRGTCIEHVAL